MHQHNIDQLTIVGSILAGVIGTGEDLPLHSFVEPHLEILTLTLTNALTSTRNNHVLHDLQDREVPRPQGPGATDVKTREQQEGRVT